MYFYIKITFLNSKPKIYNFQVYFNYATIVHLKININHFSKQQLYTNNHRQLDIHIRTLN